MRRRNLLIHTPPHNLAPLIHKALRHTIKIPDQVPTTLIHQAAIKSPPSRLTFPCEITTLLKHCGYPPCLRLTVVARQNLSRRMRGTTP